MHVSVYVLYIFDIYIYIYIYIHISDIFINLSVIDLSIYLSI